MLKCLVCLSGLALFLGLTSAQAEAPRQPQSIAAPESVAEAPDQIPTGRDLDKIQADLTIIEKRLERRDLTDGELQGLRQQIEPLKELIRDALERLEPRLAAIKTRLDQLGPKPDDKAPPESSTVTAERADQQKSYSDTDDLIKRGRLLEVEVDQTGASIIARRRELFTRSLLERVTTIASPALWSGVMREAPGAATALKALGDDWLASIDNRLDSHARLRFWGSIAFIFLLNALLAWLARRVLARNPTNSEPSRFLKILGAWWVTFVIAASPIATVFILGLVFEAFDLTNARLQPLAQALSWGVVRIALAAGITRGLFAPTRANWRLPAQGDQLSEKIVYVAIVVAIIVSVTHVFEALNEIIDASLTFSIATRGLGATIAAVALGVGLAGFGGEPDDDSLGPRVSSSRDWFGLVRTVAWMVTISVLVSILIGYITLGGFLIEQAVWISAVACVLAMSTVLVDEGITAGLKPTSRFGRRLIASFGLRRNSLELLGILLSGAIRLVLYVSAGILVLAPWGLQSTDVPFDFAAAFSGFKIGDVTISPANIAIAIFIFGIAFATIHAVQEWLDQSLLPRTALDPGLRNSITTSLGYLGFLVAAGLSLGYLGLSFEKLAIVAGALSVGIGFGLQSIVNNFVSGLILLWERAVRVGDWIVVGSDQGFVRRINVRSTEIETFDRAQVIVPNSSLITGVVKNLVRNNRTGRLVIPLAVAGSADPERVREVLFSIAKSHELVMKMPAPQILFTSISANALNFELCAFISDVESIFRVRSDLHFEIFKRFTGEGFFAAPEPEPTKIEIAGLERLGAGPRSTSELARDRLMGDKRSR